MEKDLSELFNNAVFSVDGNPEKHIRALEQYIQKERGNITFYKQFKRLLDESLSKINLDDTISSGIESRDDYKKRIQGLLDRCFKAAQPDIDLNKDRPDKKYELNDLMLDAIIFNQIEYIKKNIPKNISAANQFLQDEKHKDTKSKTPANIEKAVQFTQHINNYASAEMLAEVQLSIPSLESMASESREFNEGRKDDTNTKFAEGYLKVIENCKKEMNQETSLDKLLSLTITVINTAHLFINLPAEQIQEHKQLVEITVGEIKKFLDSKVDLFKKMNGEYLDNSMKSNTITVLETNLDSVKSTINNAQDVAGMSKSLGSMLEKEFKVRDKAILQQPEVESMNKAKTTIERKIVIVSGISQTFVEMYANDIIAEYKNKFKPAAFSSERVIDKLAEKLADKDCEEFKSLTQDERKSLGKQIVAEVTKMAKKEGITLSPGREEKLKVLKGDGPELDNERSSSLGKP